MTSPDNPRSLSGLAPEELLVAKEIVAEILGEGFAVEYTFPKSVGLKGDDRTFEPTAVVTSTSESPARGFAERYNDVQDVTTGLTNKTRTGRVVIDVTPPDAEARFISEERNEPVVSFEQRVLRRIEGYVILKRKYGNRLVRNPSLQWEAWDEMNARDQEIMASMKAREERKA